MKKRLWTILLALIMVLSVAPFALADTPDNQLPQAQNGVITLTKDVTLSATYKVADNNVIIDLAGHTLAYDGADNVFLDVQGGSLTIRDSRGNGEVKVNEPYDGTDTAGKTQRIKCVQVRAGATFTLEGGTLTNTNTAFEATQVISNYGTTYIEGGTVKGVTGIFIFNPVRGNAAWTNSASTCNVSGGRIEGVAPTTYQGQTEYKNEKVADLNWSYGIAIYGPGVDSIGVVDNNKSVLNISGGTITAGQAIGTNASSGRYAGYTINMSGGTVDGGTGTGMYLPAIGETNISGGTVTAAQAIRICAGELNVTGGTITCTAVSDGDDLVAGGSGGTPGAIVVGKASGGYVGDIDVNVSGKAVVQNTANGNDSNVLPTIVVSDKNMALASDQYIKDPATGNNTNETFKYSETSTSVTVNATIKGDIVKISNLTSSTTQDGGNTSLDITGGTVTGNVINQTSAGDLKITDAEVTGDVKNDSKGTVVISEGATVTGSVSNTNGSVSILNSTVGSTTGNGITIIGSTVGGNPTTNLGGNVALVNGKGYATLQDAVDAVTTGEETTITLLDSASGNGVKIQSGNKIIFDLGGFTYNIDGGTVGSSGTETNGFQLLKNSDITFKNGTITSTKAKILIQNYSNLTLDGVTLNGAQLVGSAPYTLSNNFGNTVIKDSTIIAKEGGFAFDVYYWPENGYGDGLSVTVEGNSEITGKIEYGRDSSDVDKDAAVAEKAKLNITGGTFTGELRVGQIGTSSKAGINITGGTFQATDTSKWAGYVQPGMKLDENGSVVIDTENAVAKIGDVGYDSLSAAVAAAQDGDTITMLKEYDATNEGTITFNADKTVTLDLGGYELTLSRFDLVRGWLTVKNGSVKCDPTDGQAFNVYAGPTATEELYTKLVIEKDVTINAAYGICLFPGSGKAGYSSAIEVYGKIESGGIFVSGNLGNDKATAKAMAESGKIPTVTIHEGAVVNNGSEGQGIAMNGLANVTVEGGTISGSEAIGVKRGTLTVEGGTFISNGDYVNPAEANHNGTENTGATISITSTYNYAGTINVNLNGGTFTSEKAPAVYLGHSEEKISGGQTTSSNVYAEGVTLNIQGGTFTSPDNAPTVYVAAKADGDADTYTQQVISGGTFSTKVRDYLDNSIRYEVAHQTGNFSYTKTMEDAQTLVQPGDTITELNVAQGTTTYSLTLDYNDGDVTADVTYTVSSGTTVTLPKPPARTNYTFGGWSDGTTTYNDGTSYTVNATVTLTAQWLYIPPVKPSYPVNLPAVTGGKVTASPASAQSGSTVTLTVTPDEGYELASLTVTDYLGNQIALSGSGSRYTFTMPASQVKVTATFTKTGEPTLPFTDVSEDNWAYGDIVYVYENGLMQGDSATIFDRLSSISRKEIVTILYRLAGEPAVAADNGFADVADGVWYADAVNWAVAEGVTQGVGGNRFDPDAAITRQDLAVMLWRYAGEPAGDLSALEGYRDEDSVSGYARAALAWAVEQGIVTGVGDSTLDPMGSAQRQQAAAMIRRLAERVQA